MAESPQIGMGSSFRQLGQYADAEMGLCDNRFRYYDPEAGQYVSQAPIGLQGGNPTLYGYVRDVNWLVNFFGLNPIIVIGEGQSRVNAVARSLKGDNHDVRTITDDWVKEFKNYDPYIKELHEKQSIEYNRRWIRERIEEGYDVYDIGAIGNKSPFYAAENHEIRKIKYNQHYGYNPNTKLKFKVRLKCK